MSATTPAIQEIEKAIDVAATSHDEAVLSLTQIACSKFLGADVLAEQAERERAAGNAHARYTLNYTHTRPEVMAALTIRLMEEFRDVGGAAAVEQAIDALPSPRRTPLYNANMQARISARFPEMTPQRITSALRPSY